MSAEWQDVAQVVKELSDALETFDWPRSHEICDRLIARLNGAAEACPIAPAKQILNLLRRKRRFAQMELVADAFIRTGHTAPVIKRQHAQALIDQGSFSKASVILKSILDDAASPDLERAEANGLLGRIYKQLYLNANNPLSQDQQANLRLAVYHYYEVYKTAPKTFLWHGINTVALLARAARDHVAIEGYPSVETIAREIGAVLAQMEDLTYWDRATSVETALALDDHKAAYARVCYYVADPQVDAFEIGSLLRQLTEVWGLSMDEEPGTRILPTLRAALLQREGGRVDVAHGGFAMEKETQSATENLHQVLGASRYLPLSWYKTGLKRCEAVARIESLDGIPYGTGFLVRAADFFPGRDTNELVLLTNAHVVAAPGYPFKGALQPKEARALFEIKKNTFRVKDVLWTSPPHELDATFVTLESLDEDFEYCPVIPPANSFDPKVQRVYLIAHQGEASTISIQDTICIDSDGTRLHYRAPTTPGSSGSPVFDEHDWTLVAIHHALIETRLPGAKPGAYDGEGIQIGAIQQAIQGRGAPKVKPPKVRVASPSLPFYRLLLKPGLVQFLDPVNAAVGGEHPVTDMAFAMGSRAARKQLKAFAEEHDNDSPFDPVVAGAFLIAMAKWGRDWYGKIFNDTNKNIREAIENLEQGSRLGIDTPYKSFPWEWVFINKVPSDPSFVKDPDKLAAMLSGFFGIRFEVEIFPAFNQKRWGLREQLPNETKTVVMAAINATAFVEIANRNLEFISGLPTRYNPPSVETKVFSGKDGTIAMLKRAVDRSADAPHVLYFYCHHSAGAVLTEYGFLDGEQSKLIMSGSDADLISVDDLVDIGLDDFQPDRSPLIFLNACGTAQGQDFSPSGFIRYFTELLAASAVLGTLAEVPASHAYNFAEEFIEGWLKGEQAATALRRLRIEWMRNHYNPFPMFYTLHGIGHLGLKTPLTELEYDALHHQRSTP